MKLVHPSTVLISGPTGSGKTVFASRLVSEMHFDPPPNKIIWIYSEYQPIYDELEHAVEFIKGGSSDVIAAVYGKLDPELNNVLILDDQMEDGTNSKALSKLFTQGSHHRNTSVVYLVQNLFSQSKSHRTISLNAHYVVLFKNPRDKTQIETFARQMYPHKWRFLIGSFEHATRKPFSYLLIDLRPETPDEFRVRTKIFNDQVESVYVPI